MHDDPPDSYHNKALYGHCGVNDWSCNASGATIAKDTAMAPAPETFSTISETFPAFMLTGPMHSAFTQ